MEEIIANENLTGYEPTTEELKEQLMKAQQAYAALRAEAQQRIEALNYTNAFQQQQFMLEIIKQKDVFPQDIVDKAIASIDSFWFADSNEDFQDGQE